MRLRPGILHPPIAPGTIVCKETFAFASVNHFSTVAPRPSPLSSAVVLAYCRLSSSHFPSAFPSSKPTFPDCHRPRRPPYFPIIIRAFLPRRPASSSADILPHRRLPSSSRRLSIFIRCPSTSSSTHRHRPPIPHPRLPSVFPIIIRHCPSPSSSVLVVQSSSVIVHRIRRSLPLPRCAS